MQAIYSLISRWQRTIRSTEYSIQLMKRTELTPSPLILRDAALVICSGPLCSTCPRKCRPSNGWRVIPQTRSGSPAGLASPELHQTPWRRAGSKRTQHTRAATEAGSDDASGLDVSVRSTCLWFFCRPTVDVRAQAGCHGHVTLYLIRCPRTSRIFSSNSLDGPNFFFIRVTSWASRCAFTLEIRSGYQGCSSETRQWVGLVHQKP